MAHWRNTFRPARFFFLDVRVGVVTLCALLHLRVWTVSIVLLIILLAWWTERIGLSFPSAMRAGRSWLAGTVRPALAPYKVRRKVDYGHRRLPWEKRPEVGTHELTPVEVVRQNNL